MQIEMTSRNVNVDSALEELVARKLAYALDSWGDLDDKRFEVRFVDVNAARGGRDKYCRITVSQGLEGGPLLAEAVADTAEMALAGAVNRLAKRLRRGRKRVIAKRRRNQVATPTWWD